MHRSLLFTATLLSLACSRERAGNASASAYTSDADSSVRAAGIEGTASGSELEAPTLIPAVQNQLNLMSSKSHSADPNNLTAYKNLAGDLVNSMAADMYRVGQADSGRFRVLRDSVMDELGGGAGTPATLDPADLKGHIGRMRHLISLYQVAIKAEGKR
jgi:hypothetical protein